MTPRERLLNVMRGKPVDRVPLVLEAFHFDTREQLAEVADPGRREIAERIWDEVHVTPHVSPYLNRYLVTPVHKWRSETVTRPNGDTITTQTLDTPKGPLTAVGGTNPVSRTHWQIKYPVESMEDIDKIRSVPWEPHPDLTAPTKESLNLPPDFATRGVVRTGVSCPAVCVAAMMPFEMFLELCLDEEELLKELAETCMKRTLATLDIVLATGLVEYVWMGGCEWLTPPMASPAIYEALVQPYEKPIIDRIHAGGAIAHVHCHGNVRDTIEWVIERGADFFEPVEPPPDGDIPFAEAKALVAGRVTLGGNVEARVLENENENAAEAACRAAFEGTKERMVFQTTAGPIGAMSPQVVKNYHTLVDVWEECSPL